jgi:hypothetical protein
MAMLKHPEKIIFEYSRPTRGSYGQWPTEQRTPDKVAADIQAFADALTETLKAGARAA